MRIETPTVAPVSADAKSGQSASTAQQPSSTATSSPAAVVTLSSAAAGAAKSTATSTGEIREMPDPKVLARIAQIRQQLQNGSYPIDLDVLATRIADDEVARGAS